MFCRQCLLSVFREQKKHSLKSNESKTPTACGGACPVCHYWVKTSAIVQITKSEKGEMYSEFLNQLPESEKENSPNTTTEIHHRVAMARETLESAVNGASSSKLEAILAELDKIHEEDDREGGKVLMFSQYLGFLDIVGIALDKIGVETFRVDGGMTLKERVSAVRKFNQSRRGSVFLISMKAGGVGLNLVAASSVFILDPWWNQAIVSSWRGVRMHAK